MYFSQSFFVKIFEPSSCEAILFGPKTFMLFFFKKSPIPSTRGFSGPTITISILSHIDEGMPKDEFLKILENNIYSELDILN